MNAFKAVSTRSGYWMDYETNRHNKRRSRRKARHVLNSGKNFQKILLEAIDKAG